MNIIAVDDERPALWLLEKAIQSIIQSAQITCFQSATEALEYARNHVVDIAFLDIEMAEMNGLSLAKKLKDIYRETNIIFVTGYSAYSGNAFDIHASGYVLKPIDPERVKRELENLRYPVKKNDKGIRIQCFGNFEIFVDEKPLTFGRSKSKETLAYLVDRKGSGVNNKELASILWGDAAYTRTTQSHLRTILAEMMKTLKNAGAEHIIINQRNSRSIDTSKVDCDYYRFDMGDVNSINAYRGEYMANYSWAEFTIGLLTKE